MSRSGCGLKRVVRCTGTGHGGRVALHGVANTPSSDQRQCVLAESLSYASRSGGFRVAISWQDRFGRQKTFESELARTRGIRLSN
jgi:hypothetical protein